MELLLLSREVEDIEPLIDSLQILHGEGTLQNHPAITNINHFASRDSRKHMQQAGPGPLTADSLSRMMEKYNTGYWRGYLELYGTKQLVLARFARVEEVIAEKVPRVRLETTLFEGTNGNPVDNSKVGTFGAGAPSMIASTIAEYNLPADGSGKGAHIDTTMILPADGKVTLDWFRKARSIMENHGTDLGADPFIGCHVFNKHILFVQGFIFDRAQAAHRDRGLKVVSSLLSEAKAAGFANYRSHLQYMGAFPYIRPQRLRVLIFSDEDAIQDVYDFNGHMYRKFVENLKVGRFALKPSL